MRVGVSSRGNAWVSLGCFGWLILGPILLCAWLAVAAVKLIALLCVAVWQMCHSASDARRRDRVG